jgi:hypothetical protein
MSQAGFVYIAGGAQKYVEEATISAHSLKQVQPDAHVTLITDRDLSAAPFDAIVVQQGNFSDWKSGLAFKVDCMYRCSPYDHTLYLDTDTYFYENCQPLFELLRYFDICMANAPSVRDVPYLDEVPFTICQPYNTGVIAFRKNTTNEALFRNWSTQYHSNLEREQIRPTKRSDQAAFMEALLLSQSRVYSLRDIWNARITKCLTLRDLVKIVHGRHPHYEELRHRINGTDQFRFWDPARERCIAPANPKSKRIKLANQLSQKKMAYMHSKPRVDERRISK